MHRCLKLYLQNFNRSKTPSLDYLHSTSSQLHAPETAQRTRANRAQCASTFPVLLMLRTSDTNKSQESLHLCHRMSKCWQSSACNCQIVPYVSLLSAGCLPNTEKSKWKMSTISTKAAVHKVSDSTLHHALSEVVVHLWATINRKLLKPITSSSCLTFWLEYTF